MPSRRSKSEDRERKRKARLNLSTEAKAIEHAKDKARKSQLRERMSV